MRGLRVVYTFVYPPRINHRHELIIARDYLPARGFRVIFARFSRRVGKVAERRGKCHGWDRKRAKFIAGSSICLPCKLDE